MSAQVSRKTPVTAALAAQSNVVSMRLVPQILQAPSNLVRELNSGLDTYVATIQSAITSDLQSRIVEVLDTWFPDSEKHHTDKLLKKITNSCLSPGVSGFTRTHDALKTIGYWDNDAAPKSFTSFIGSDGAAKYGLVARRISANSLKCFGCEKQRKNIKIMFEVSSNLRNKTAKNVWHSDCLATHILRELAKSHRSAKGSLDKQSIAVRGILGANKNNPILKGKKAHLEELSTAAQYDSWLTHFFNYWAAATKLKEESQAAYQSSFIEYANAITEYARTGTFPVDATKQRLLKHFDSKEVDSVIDQFLTPRQIHILEVIRESLDNNGFAPTFREIGNKVGLTSSESVKYQLEILRNHGYLRSKSDQHSASAAPFESQDDEKSSSFADTESSRIVSIDAKDYSDGRLLGEVYREGIPVILNCSQMQDDDRKRLIDFASGLVFASKGTIERVAQSVFLLTPADVVIQSEDKSATRITE